MLDTKVACPQCHTVLKSAKPVPMGIRVKCPKCSVFFTTGESNGHGTTNGNGVQAPPLNGRAPAIPPLRPVPTAMGVTPPPRPGLYPAIMPPTAPQPSNGGRI